MDAQMVMLFIMSITSLITSLGTCLYQVVTTRSKNELNADLLITKEITAEKYKDPSSKKKPFNTNPEDIENPSQDHSRVTHQKTTLKLNLSDLNEFQKHAVIKKIGAEKKEDQHTLDIIDNIPPVGIASKTEQMPKIEILDDNLKNNQFGSGKTEMGNNFHTMSCLVDIVNNTLNPYTPSNSRAEHLGFDHQNGVQPSINIIGGIEDQDGE